VNACQLKLETLGNLEYPPAPDLKDKSRERLIVEALGIFVPLSLRSHLTLRFELLRILCHVMVVLGARQESGLESSWCQPI
jgi:hypothetical protein